jgi:hypothetical protein
MAGVAAGVGLRLWGQDFDYAWVPFGDLGTTQYFSLVLRFGSVKRALAALNPQKQDDLSGAFQ